MNIRERIVIERRMRDMRRLFELDGTGIRTGANCCVPAALAAVLLHTNLRVLFAECCDGDKERIATFDGMMPLRTLEIIEELEPTLGVEYAKPSGEPLLGAAFKDWCAKQPDRVIAFNAEHAYAIIGGEVFDKQKLLRWDGQTPVASYIRVSGVTGIL